MSSIDRATSRWIGGKLLDEEIDGNDNISSLIVGNRLKFFRQYSKFKFVVWISFSTFCKGFKLELLTWSYVLKFVKDSTRYQGLL